MILRAIVEPPGSHLGAILEPFCASWGALGPSAAILGAIMRRSWWQFGPHVPHCWCKQHAKTHQFLKIGFANDDVGIIFVHDALSQLTNRSLCLHGSMLNWPFWPALGPGPQIPILRARQLLPHPVHQNLERLTGRATSSPSMLKIVRDPGNGAGF